MPGQSMLRLEVLPAPDLSAQDNLLGGLRFSSHPSLQTAEAYPLLDVNMALLGGGKNIYELWHCTEPTQPGQRGAIQYRHSDTFLFGCLALNETTETLRTPLQTSTEAAYQSIFELLEVLGYTAVLRFWNYFPAINQTSHSIERYRQFNIGRQDAFLAHGRSVIDNTPAACALGTANGRLSIAFLAARAPVTNIENPRQVNACQYPAQYGPRSPTFSRAGLVNLNGQDMLFISGTASIVGHESRHVGNLVAQIRECLLNITAVVDEANRLAPEAHFRLDQLTYTVYVRHAEHLTIVQHELTQLVGNPLSAVYLQADICREELLVEIEASGGHAFHFISPA